MFLIAYLIVYVFVVLALFNYIGFLASRYFLLPRYPDEIHFGKTQDGWNLALVRYRPGKDIGKRPPILMIHGLAANYRNLDLNDQLSLAGALREQGYDVWLVDLRGRGLSTRPRLFSGVQYDWAFDEYVEYDLPCAAEKVRAVTGQEKLSVVAFSTGALAAYAWLAPLGDKAPVVSLVSLGGAVTFKRVAMSLPGQLIRSLRWLRHRSVIRLLAPISGYWNPGPLRVIHNPENIDGEIARRIMTNVISNFARNELLQYSDWILHDTFRSIDHRRDYRSELGQLKVPTLFLAGSKDIMAPPDAVKETYELIGATDKEFQICSRAQGMQANYGHFDLTLGRHVTQDIFPLIIKWLDKHKS